MANIEELRKEYLLAKLDEGSVNSNPFIQFDKWFNEALNSGIYEPNAMSLATSINNKPSVRIVLLKGFDDSGFTFFTNYSSHKGQNIKENNNVALTFFWSELQRQVRIEGIAERISNDKSEEYFHSRPKGSQIGALVSSQSQIINGRKDLEEKYIELLKKYENIEVPKPENWGGYIVIPQTIEFWQGRESRLHDRIFFSKQNSEWSFVRLSP
jgi:pyridoxamine 5'-phosphate oxidase